MQLCFEAEPLRIPYECSCRLVFPEIKRDINEFAFAKAADSRICIAPIHPCFPDKKFL